MTMSNLSKPIDSPARKLADSQPVQTEELRNIVSLLILKSDFSHRQVWQYFLVVCMSKN